jgi:uncharacterized membrane protein YvlD (DUF360 family)
LNLFLLYTLSQFLPGVEIKGFAPLLIFVLVFSTVSFFVHRIPPLPEIPPLGIK